MAIACERDLQNDADSDQLLQAMLKCKGWGPDCADAGRCRYHGDCFSQIHHWLERMDADRYPTTGSQRHH